MTPPIIAAPAPTIFTAPPVASTGVKVEVDALILLVGAIDVRAVPDALLETDASLETSSSRDVDTGVSAGRVESRGVAEGVITAVCRTRETEREY